MPTMTSADLTAILPLLILGGAPVLLMIVIAARRAHAAAFWITVLALLAAFGSLWIAAGVAPRAVTPLLEIDHYALFYTGMIVAATLAVTLLTYGYLEKHDVQREEMYMLYLIATLGSAVLVSSSHLVSFFLGMEVLSISLYGLAAYLPASERALEAGVKYLVLAAASAAFLLFGMALVYMDLGTMSFRGMTSAIAQGLNPHPVLMVPGIALIITGIGFKLAVVPFHLWTPDVYEGAPAPVTAYIASVSKGAMFGLLLRYFYVAGPAGSRPLMLVFEIIAIASMFAGNLLALMQNNVKRILAYSSIAHLGYILVAFEAGGVAGAGAVTFYLVAYFITTLGAFGVVTVLSTGDRDADRLEDYRGLFWRRPGLAGIFTAMLLSLAGIPVTAGFIGKFYVVAAGASSTLWALIIILVVTSAIGLFYYLRVVFAMYEHPPEGAELPPQLPPLAAGGTVTLAVLAVLLVWVGIFPGPLLSLIQNAVAAIV
jgi:NADH-quinone oxidoreductase subunit N